MLARLCVALSIVLSLQQGVSAKTVFVAQSGNNTTGHSWSTAIRSLQDAIYAATEGDTIWVKYGHQREITITKKLYLYGGFRGDETSLSERSLDWQTNVSDISYGGPCVHIKAESRMDGFEISKGGNPDGSAGGLVIEASATLINCLVINNRGTFRGGIHHSAGGEPLTLINCLIAGNETVLSPEHGFSVSTAISYFGDKPLRVIGCTIVDNATDPCCSDEEVDIAIRGSGGIEVTGSIILGNIVLDHDGTYYPTMTATYSNLWGDWPGVGNINVDPLFKDNGYRLGIGSPCIDTGTQTGSIIDLNGDPRPVDIPGMGRDGEDAYDMGVYEFQFMDLLTPTPTKTRTITKTPTISRTPTITMSPTMAETPTETGTPTFTETPLPTPTIDPRADINDDGSIGVEDLLILQREWGRNTGE